MKKLISFLICMLIASISSFCLSEGRNIAEFCQLFMNRVDVNYNAVEGVDLSYDAADVKSEILSRGDNSVTIKCLAGEATIDLNTMEISKLVMTPLYGDINDDSYDLWALKTIIAISALEFDPIENRKIWDDGQFSGAFGKAVSIWNESFMVNPLSRAITEEKDVLAYVGEDYSYWAHLNKTRPASVCYIAYKNTDSNRMIDEPTNMTDGTDSAESFLKYVSKDTLDNLSNSDLLSLKAEISIAIISKSSKSTNKHHSRILDIDLSDLSIDELKAMRDYLSNSGKIAYSEPDIDTLVGSKICDYDKLSIVITDAELRKSAWSSNVDLILSVIIENNSITEYEGYLNSAIVNGWEVGSVSWFKIGAGHKQANDITLKLKGIGISDIDDIADISVSFKLLYSTHFKHITDIVTLKLK